MQHFDDNFFRVKRTISYLCSQTCSFVLIDKQKSIKKRNAHKFQGKAKRIHEKERKKKQQHKNQFPRSANLHLLQVQFESNRASSIWSNVQQNKRVAIRFCRAVNELSSASMEILEIEFQPPVRFAREEYYASPRLPQRVYTFSRAACARTHGQKTTSLANINFNNAI